VLHGHLAHVFVVVVAFLVVVAPKMKQKKQNTMGKMPMGLMAKMAMLRARKF
jgi:uncharacterized membrane protein YkvI